ALSSLLLRIETERSATRKLSKTGFEEMRTSGTDDEVPLPPTGLLARLAEVVDQISSFSRCEHLSRIAMVPHTVEGLFASPFVYRDWRTDSMTNTRGVLVLLLTLLVDPRADSYQQKPAATSESGEKTVSELEERVCIAFRTRNLNLLRQL